MPSSEVDTKISKIRSLVDWRINDISKVLRQAEDEWAQKLEEERLKRQESFESVQGLAETTKLMFDVSLSTESSRIDAFRGDLTKCQLELMECSEMMHDMTDDVEFIKKGMEECLEEVKQLKAAAELERQSREEGMLTFSSDIHHHKVAISQVASTQRALVNELHERVDRLDMNPMSTQLLRKSDEADGPETLQTPQLIETLTCTKHRMEQFDAVQKEHSERLKLLLQALEGLRQQDTSVKVSLRQAKKECAALIEAEQTERRESLSTLRQDVNSWEYLLTNFVERADNCDKALANVNTQQQKKTVEILESEPTSPHFGEASPSAAVLDATRDGRITQLISRFDAEQSERKDAVKMMQTQLNDMQTIQKNNSQELGTLRLQLSNNQSRSSSNRDNDLRDVQDAMSGLERDMKAQQVTLQTKMAQATDLTGSITGDLDETKRELRRLGDSLFQVMSFNTMLSDRIKEVDAQGKDAFESLRKDVTSLPALLWESASKDRERLDSLASKFDELVIPDETPRIEASAIRDVYIGSPSPADKAPAPVAMTSSNDMAAIAMDSLAAMEEQLQALRDDVDAVISTTHDSKNLSAMCMKAVSREEERVNYLDQQMEIVRKEQRRMLEPAIKKVVQARDAITLGTPEGALRDIPEAGPMLLQTPQNRGDATSSVYGRAKRDSEDITSKLEALVAYQRTLKASFD